MVDGHRQRGRRDHGVRAVVVAGNAMLTGGLGVDRIAGELVLDQAELHHGEDSGNRHQPDSVQSCNGPYHSLRTAATCRTIVATMSRTRPARSTSASRALPSTSRSSTANSRARVTVRDSMSTPEGPCSSNVTR